jgi:exosome complex RNA-binding protein Csl4
MQSISNVQGFINNTIIALPGEVLVASSQNIIHEAGIGCYLDVTGSIRSCQSGVIIREAKDGGKGYKWCVVSPENDKMTKNVVLVEGDRVLCKVQKLMINQINCDILSVDDTELSTTARGVIRREDVRQTETDQLSMAECFQPGDIVRATIISLGDSKQYFLSTADKDGGVRFAMSKNGNVMQPLSWLAMLDPVTGLTESRKVAAP